MRVVHLGGLLGATLWLLVMSCGGEEGTVLSSSGAGGAAGGSTASGTGTGATGSSASGSNAAGTGGAADTCGDFVCDPAECAGGTCSPDCGATCMMGCGDGTCDPTETCSSCPADCQTGCGDGCCLIGEDCMGCPMDCVTVESCDPSACGNGQCNYGLSETCLNCADCFGLCDCGDGNCVAPETQALCPWDC